MDDAEFFSKMADVCGMRALCSTDDEIRGGMEECEAIFRRLRKRTLARAYEEMLQEDIADELAAS